MEPPRRRGGPRGRTGRPPEPGHKRTRTSCRLSLGLSAYFFVCCLTATQRSDTSRAQGKAVAPSTHIGGARASIQSDMGRSRAGVSTSWQGYPGVTVIMIRRSISGRASLLQLFVALCALTAASVQFGVSPSVASAKQYNDYWYVSAQNSELADQLCAPSIAPCLAYADPCPDTGGAYLAEYCQFGGSYPEFHSWTSDEIMNIGRTLYNSSMQLYISTPGSWSKGVYLDTRPYSCAGYCIEIFPPTDQYDSIYATLPSQWSANILQEGWTDTGCDYGCGADELFGYECANGPCSGTYGARRQVGALP